MGSRLYWVFLFAATCGMGAFFAASGQRVAPVTGSTFLEEQSELARPFVPAVSMNEDRRVATSSGQAMKSGGVLSATGLIRCGAAVGTGQLTVRNDVITTAAHVLIDQDGRKRTGCVFEPTMKGEGAVPLDAASIRTGSKMPLAEHATKDWAVARLAAPIKGVNAYAVGSASAPGNIMMCAGGNREFAAMGTEKCAIRRVIGTSSDGIREVAIDCNAGPGSSGAALISGTKVVGIYVGYRSSNPEKAQAFSDTHYNFGISIDGPFRQALYNAAN